MIRFHGGPADGKSLDLRRAPLLLRVVIDVDGAVDALDQLDDVAKPTERIHVYRRAGDAGRGIACSRGRGCQRFLIADYLPHSVQPTDGEARDNARWQQWAAVAADAVESDS